MAFFVPSQHLFGIPERSDKFVLKTTENSDPYRLYNVDMFPHDAFAMEGLYGCIPFITSHTGSHDESILWLNAAETWIDILKWN
jgi:alpha 1,3-glucosidase